MARMIEYPPTLRGNPEEKLQTIFTYLYQLAEELRLALDEQEEAQGGTVVQVVTKADERVDEIRKRLNEHEQRIAALEVQFVKPLGDFVIGTDRLA